MDLLDKLQGVTPKPVTNKKLISNENLVFLKIFNVGWTLALLVTAAPSSDWWVVEAMHTCGAVVYVLCALANLVALGVLWPRRPGKTFNPFIIIGTSIFATAATLLTDVISMVLFHTRGFVIQLALYIPFVVAARYVVPVVRPGFGTFVLADVWMYFFVFVIRKLLWLASDFKQLNEIVRYFKTTCWDRVEKAPRTELVYAASTGLINTLARQLGKLLALVVAQHTGNLSLFQAIYIGGTVSNLLSSILLMKPMLKWGVGWFSIHHTHNHLSAARYLVMHFEHHDALPLASIASGDTGYQEAFHESLSPLQGYQNSVFIGFSPMFYIQSMFDEWAHNFCPTVRYSGVIATKFGHLEHHMNRTLPIGLPAHEENIPVENARTGWKHSESVWSHIQTFSPGLVYKIPKNSEEFLTTAIKSPHLPAHTPSKHRTESAPSVVAEEPPKGAQGESPSHDKGAQLPRRITRAVAVTSAAVLLVAAGLGRAQGGLLSSRLFYY